MVSQLLRRERVGKLPWLTIQIVAANVAVVLALATAWYIAFTQQSDVYFDRLMSTFNIEPGQLHAMYVADVERQLWTSVILGLGAATLASVAMAFLIVRPLQALAKTTERLRHGDYRVRPTNEIGEIGHLASNINALANSLELEEQRREQYLADLGHELRTPITSLRGYIEGLEDGVFKADKAFFDLLSGELSQLTALTHTIDAMQLSDVEIDGDQTCKQVDVGGFLKGAINSWTARFRERGLQVDLQIPKALYNRRFAVRENCLKQIADNLLSNILRYASTPSSCEITVAKGSKANSVEIIFRNEAPDIDRNSLPFLFDRFFRVSESRTRQEHEHPTGLGLSIVKQLCLANNGNANAALHGQQLAITIELPLRP